MFLLINKLMLISSFVYAYSLKKRDVMTLMIAFLDAVNCFILSIIYIAFFSFRRQTANGIERCQQEL
ncbi:hypothetical protein D9O19_05100 [Salmonella enterica]|nr:hypothetical protein [Salmonella enterica]